MPAAFPGAVGFGAASIGGRGGTIIPVTNLNDSGAGSLRTALTASGARIVVFQVAGAISPSTPIIIDNPYITIAGQTAPGSGIVVRDRIGIRTHNVIMRYLRFRDDGSGDTSALRFDNGGNLTGAYDVIVDHCSFSWYRDDTLPINPSNVSGGACYNITVQHCLFGECPDGSDHEKAMLIGHTAGLGTGLSHIRQLTIYRNAFISAGERNPNIRARDAQIINNLVYNYQNRIGEIHISRDETEGSSLDYINNYYKRGVESADRLVLYDPSPDTDADKDTPVASIYAAGNVGIGLTLPLAATDDPWRATYPLIAYHGTWTGQGAQGGGGTLDSAVHKRTSTLANQPLHTVPILSAVDAVDAIIGDCGANARLAADGSWVANADNYDAEYIADYVNDTGPTYPISPYNQSITVDSGTAYTDTDGDGMPDEWEDLHGFNPNDPSDGSIINPSGYSNVESFLNGEDDVIPPIEDGKTVWIIPKLTVSLKQTE